jgi:hypothetical protein
MFERFTFGARELVGHAAHVTAAVGDSAIGAEHLLWAAFAAEPKNPAVTALLQAGVTNNAIIPSNRMTKYTLSQVWPRLPFTEEGKTATNQTVVEARGLGADRVGVEHFVLSLLSVSDTNRRLVDATGADPEVIRNQIRSAIL